ncbi:hypothetical protein Aperf_G00000023076 [Anoplocephala perfoliata]
MGDGLFGFLASRDSKSQKSALFPEAGQRSGTGLFGNVTGNSAAEGRLFSSSKLSARSQGLFGMSLDVPVQKRGYEINLDEPRFEIEENEPSCAIDLTTAPPSENRHISNSSGLWSQLNDKTGQNRLFPPPMLAVNNASTKNVFAGYDRTSKVKQEFSTVFNKPSDSGSFSFPNSLPVVVKKEFPSATPEQKLPFFTLPNRKSSSVPSLAPNTEANTFVRATTVKQRLAALEAKDKAERDRRQAVSGSSSLSDGSLRIKPVTVGNCPDMCPETERYIRETRHRVSVFEYPSGVPAPGTAWPMDHTRAVKDYSRSAADQAEPLPWELRPPEVLERTTNYLLAAIADRPEKDGADNLWKPWYEFLWTRTRAIRKDIIQQRLCSLPVISIVEKITRFHIFCAARLVDQTMDAFDPRINSENLTQCLQTLKELYADIHNSWGAASSTKHCPCEPEFRAYMIFMNLNECSVLDEVQKFSESLRKSAEVQFAISVHSAVAEHNYVRFFQLIRKADCLSACLLHRYFGQVRSYALRALSAAFHGHPKHEVIFPLAKFLHQLGFESSEDAQDFCEHWGLQVSDKGVTFARDAPPREPDFAWKERRAPKLVEGKREGRSLGDLFNGGPIDLAYAKPGPVHSSFDAEGNLLPVPMTQESPFCPSPTVLTAPSLVAVDEVIDVDAEDDDDYNDHPKVIIAQSSVEAPQPAFRRDFMFADVPMTSKSTESPPTLYIGDDEEESEEQNQQTPSIDDAITTEAAESIAVDLINETVDQLTTQAVNQEITQYRSLVSTVVEESVENIVQDFVQSTSHDVVREVIGDTSVMETVDDLVTEELHDMASVEMKKASANHFNSVRLQRCAFNAWKSVSQTASQKKRENEHTFEKLLAVPAAPASCLWMGDSRARCPCHQRLWDYEVVETKRPRLTSSSASEIKSRPVLQPLDSLSTFQNVQIAVLTFPKYDEFNKWLSFILQDYTRLNRISLVDRLSGSEDGLIVVGKTFSNLHIPQLSLYPPGLMPPVENSENAIMKNIEFPALTDWWSHYLEKGLVWLAEKVISGRDVSGIRIKTENTVTEPMYLSLRYSTLNEVVTSHIENSFSKPLIEFIHHWDEHGLTHPDPHNILAAYNQCLDPLPKRARDNLAINPLPGPIPTDCSWQEAVNIWHTFLHSRQFSESFAESVGYSPEDYEEWRRVSPLLIPWGNLCIHLIRAKMEDTMLADGEDDDIRQCEVPVSAFENLGSQFLVMEIRSQTRRPLAVRLNNTTQGLPSEGPFDCYAQISQRLEDVTRRISGLSETARSITK